MGDFASKAGKLATEEINAAGGVLGRQLETIVDDETNPGVGVQKATKMIQQDKVDFLLGTVSSAVALAIMDVAERYQKIFFNTGSNSDQIAARSATTTPSPPRRRIPSTSRPSAAIW